MVGGMYERQGVIDTTSIHQNQTLSRFLDNPEMTTCRHVEIDLEGRWNGDQEMSQTYAVIFEQAESNWAAYVPDLPGCITTGKTLEETERNIREAIQGHLETLREFGEPVPRPTSLAKEIEIPPAA